MRVGLAESQCALCVEVSPAREYVPRMGFRVWLEP